MPEESGMDREDYTESLLDNEREWRRFIIKKMMKIEDEFSYISHEITRIKTWNTVYRLLGGGIFAILLIWIETRFK